MNLKIKLYLSIFLVLGIQVVHAASSYVGGSVMLNTEGLKRGYYTKLTYNGKETTLLHSTFNGGNSNFGLSIGNSWTQFELGLEINFHSEAKYSYSKENENYLTDGDYKFLADKGYVAKISSTDYILKTAFLVPLKKIIVSLDFGFGGSAIKAKNLIVRKDKYGVDEIGGFKENLSSTAGVILGGIGIRYNINALHSVVLNYRTTVYFGNKVADMYRSNIGISYRYYFFDNNAVAKDQVIKNGGK